MCIGTIVLQEHASTLTVACAVTFRDRKELHETFAALADELHRNYAFSMCAPCLCSLPSDVVLATANGPLPFTSTQHLLDYIRLYVLLKHDTHQPEH
jgi:hypothetical protein